jgi:hypothetical protein
MSEKRPTWEEIERDRDEPVKLPLDPEAALRGFLAVDPESGPIDGQDLSAGHRRPSAE